MQAIAGSLRTREVELQSFTIGGVAMPLRRVRVAPLYVEGAYSVRLDGVLGTDTLSSFDIDIDSVTRIAAPASGAAAWEEVKMSVGVGSHGGL